MKTDPVEPKHMQCPQGYTEGPSADGGQVPHGWLAQWKPGYIQTKRRYGSQRGALKKKMAPRAPSRLSSQVHPQIWELQEPCGDPAAASGRRRPPSQETARWRENPSKLIPRTVLPHRKMGASTVVRCELEGAQCWAQRSHPLIQNFLWLLLSLELCRRGGGRAVLISKPGLPHTQVFPSSG